MIIIVSPAKTFNREIKDYDTLPIFLNEANKHISQLKKNTVNDLIKKMRISQSLAEKTLSDYQHFGQIKTAAIHGYNGHQFRHFDINSLEKQGFKKHVKKLYILSALYGIVNAYDGISPYRLDMKDRTITNLYHYWKPKLNDFFLNHHTDDVIYNLASDEYGSLIQNIDRVITIKFYQLKNNQLTIHSMEAKKMRGLFARYLVQHPQASLTHINLEGYTFNENHSTTSCYIYVRKCHETHS